MRSRRQVITLLSGEAATWPLAAVAQQPAMPVVGYVEAGSLETTRENVAAVRRGLSDTGYVEGRNLGIEYRWAEDHLERLRARPTIWLAVRSPVSPVLSPARNFCLIFAP